MSCQLNRKDSSCQTRIAHNQRKFSWSPVEQEISRNSVRFEILLVQTSFGFFFPRNKNKFLLIFLLSLMEKPNKNKISSFLLAPLPSWFNRRVNHVNVERTSGFESRFFSLIFSFHHRFTLDRSKSNTCCQNSHCYFR